MIEGTIGVPAEYFLQMAKHDYQDWRLALPREFYQNSIDAGASKIEVIFNEKERTIEVQDNGCGMTEDVIREKLLVLGGSHKARGSVGAFGKAKELLYFSWEKYEIWTEDILVQGAGAKYSISSASNFQKGTLSKIWVQESEEFSRMAPRFRAVAAKMQAPCKIMVDGEEVPCTARRGSPVRTIPGLGSLYRVASRNREYMPVRIQGIWMFDLYVGSEVGELVFELERSSLDVLTSNRDGMKWESQHQVELLIKEFHVNPLSALEGEGSTEELFFKGRGPVIVSDPDRIREAALNLGRRALETARELAREAGLEPDPLLDARLLQILAASESMSSQEMRKMLEMLGSRPDFITLIPEGGDRVVSEWLSKHRKKTSLLSKMWTEVIRQVLLDTRNWCTFTPGFTFKKGQEACYRCQDGGASLQFLLNPMMIERVSPRADLAEELRLFACHEVAHINREDHNQVFASELHRILKATWKSRAIYSRLARLRTMKEIIDDDM